MRNVIWSSLVIKIRENEREVLGYSRVQPCRQGDVWKRQLGNSLIGNETLFQAKFSFRWLKNNNSRFVSLGRLLLRTPCVLISSLLWSLNLVRQISTLPKFTPTQLPQPYAHNHELILVAVQVATHRGPILCIVVATDWPSVPVGSRSQTVNGMMNNSFAGITLCN